MHDNVIQIRTSSVDNPDHENGQTFLGFTFVQDLMSLISSDFLICGEPKGLLFAAKLGLSRLWQ